jgi:Protein of unknown function (DUF2829)
MNFGQAVEALKAGGIATRKGWDGKGMFLLLIPGSTFAVSEGRPMARHFEVGSEIKYHAHIDMKTAQGDIVPWLASQSDVLAEDWEVSVPFNKCDGGDHAVSFRAGYNNCPKCGGRLIVTVEGYELPEAPKV